MKRALLIEERIGETAFALCENGTLTDYALRRRIGGMGAEADGFVLGRITSVKTAVNGAFVEIGAAAPGFLSALDAAALASEADNDAPIGTLVREGGTVLLMVSREAINGKGPRLTADLRLAGERLVYAPRRQSNSFSKALTEKAERRRLAAALERLGIPGGFIMRSGAAEARNEEIAAEAEALQRRWLAVETAADAMTAPGPVEASGTWLPADFPLTDLEVIRVQGARARTDLLADLQIRAPRLLGRVTAHHGSRALFDDQGVGEAIAALTEPRVPLPGGGWVRFDTTEALTAVDVNSAAAGEGPSARTQARTVSLAAVPVIARHLRLRAIGGLIVIDFPALDTAGQRQVRAALQDAMAQDPASYRIGAFSAFGLLELTRRQSRRPFAALVPPAPPARDWAAAGLAAAEALTRRLEPAPHKALVLRAAPDLAAWWAAHRSAIEPEIGRHAAGRYRIVADSGLSGAGALDYVIEDDDGKEGDR